MGTTSVKHKGKEIEVVFNRTNPEWNEIPERGPVMIPARNSVKEIYEDGRLVTNQYSPKDIEAITEKIN